jgi:imidazoleglycerol phosphate dehydratase HisB
MEEYQRVDAVRHARLIRYLLAKADSRGLTHGEKHHLIVVAIMTLDALRLILGDRPGMERFDDSSVPDAPQLSDIPF